MRAPERGTTPIGMGAATIRVCNPSTRYTPDVAAGALVELADLYTEGAITSAELVIRAHHITVHALAAATSAHRRAA